jgi:hypothetical protein
VPVQFTVITPCFNAQAWIGAHSSTAASTARSCRWCSRNRPSGRGILTGVGPPPTSICGAASRPRKTCALQPVAPRAGAVAGFRSRARFANLAALVPSVIGSADVLATCDFDHFRHPRHCLLRTPLFQRADVARAERGVRVGCPVRPRLFARRNILRDVEGHHGCVAHALPRLVSRSQEIARTCRRGTHGFLWSERRSRHQTEHQDRWRRSDRRHAVARADPKAERRSDHDRHHRVLIWCPDCGGHASCRV